jgi:hypothetical protein
MQLAALGMWRPNHGGGWLAWRQVAAAGGAGVAISGANENMVKPSAEAIININVNA